MSHCGSPGMCGGRSDCPDKHCPGRGMADQVGYESAGRVPDPVPQPTGWNWPLIGYVSAAIVGAWFLYLIATRHA
jgi:hypothetical protein